jgi:hypothetical protein
MSAISEKVRVALYSKLNVSGVTTLATGGIFESVATDPAELPYLIFRRQGSEPVVYSMGATQQLESDLWLIKAVADEDSDTTKGPQKLCEDILTAATTALGTTLTLSGNTVVWFYRFADIPPYEEILNDRHIFHRGFLLKVSTT